MAAERAKREAWMANQTRSIKQATIKGLEPEIQARAAGMGRLSVFQGRLVLLVPAILFGSGFRSPEGWRGASQVTHVLSSCSDAHLAHKCRFAPCSAWSNPTRGSSRRQSSDTRRSLHGAWPLQGPSRRRGWRRCVPNGLGSALRRWRQSVRQPGSWSRMRRGGEEARDMAHVYAACPGGGRCMGW